MAGLLAGRVSMRLNVDVPVDTELQQGCIWRQARGSATEASGIEDVRGSSEEVPTGRAHFFARLSFIILQTVQNFLLHAFSISGVQLFGVRTLVLLNNGKMNWIILPL
ncbi:unnamed protein product [Prunus armeniaca]